jgi:SnoaL-like domain
VTPPSAAVDRAADFVRRFEEFWASRSLDLLDGMFTEDARLQAPMTPTTHSLTAAKRAFADVFELIPDLSVEVHGWGATDSGVLINFTLRGSAGGAPVSWTAVDRFAIREDGLATERVSYFDSLPLMLTVARRPRAWPGFVRSRLPGRSKSAGP